MGKGSLTVVGSGIAPVRHATHEACFHITRADKVFFLVVDPVTRGWIERLNPRAESLAVHLVPGKDRQQSFAEMVESIVAAVHQGSRVCAVFYGHPGVFVQPSHMAIHRLRAEGYEAVMLPGVSTEDCLVSDLAIDMSQSGYQCFEASNFLVYGKQPDVTAALILWQVGVIGQVKCGVGREDGLRILTERLLRFYPPEHQVTVYEAAKLPICDPVMPVIAVRELADYKIGTVATLYVPAAKAGTLDQDMVERLHLNAG